MGNNKDRKSKQEWDPWTNGERDRGTRLLTPNRWAQNGGSWLDKNQRIQQAQPQQQNPNDDRWEGDHTRVCICMFGYMYIYICICMLGIYIYICICMLGMNIYICIFILNTCTHAAQYLTPPNPLFWCCCCPLRFVVVDDVQEGPPNPTLPLKERLFWTDSVFRVRCGCSSWSCSHYCCWLLLYTVVDSSSWMLPSAIYLMFVF